MVRAIALSIALLFGLGVIVPIATEYAEAGAKTVRKYKKKKRSWRGVKKYSKRWWQLYNAQERRKKMPQSIKTHTSASPDTQCQTERGSDRKRTTRCSGMG